LSQASEGADSWSSTHSRSRLLLAAYFASQFLEIVDHLTGCRSDQADGQRSRLTDGNFISGRDRRRRQRRVLNQRRSWVGLQGRRGLIEVRRRHWCLCVDCQQVNVCPSIMRQQKMEGKFVFTSVHLPHRDCERMPWPPHTEPIGCGPA
jgi:hypothetical protein